MQCSLTDWLTNLSFPHLKLVILEQGWKCSCKYEERRAMWPDWQQSCKWTLEFCVLLWLLVWPPFCLSFLICKTDRLARWRPLWLVFVKCFDHSKSSFSTNYSLSVFVREANRQSNFYYEGWNAGSQGRAEPRTDCTRASGGYLEPNQPYALCALGGN